MICSPCQVGGKVNSEAIAYLADGDVANFENRKIIAISFHNKCNRCECQHGTGPRLLLSERPPVSQEHAVQVSSDG